MAKRDLNLFESATSRARVIRQGEIVQVVIDGGGAFVTFMQEFNQAKKWATPKTASGNMITDRGRFFEQIGTLVSRPGSMVGTRGSGKYVENLVRAMNQAGYDIGEWMLPPELKDLATAHLKTMPKRGALAAAEAAAAEVRDRAQADDPDAAGDDGKR
ncbi:hypothetical protein [Solimonas terrae]|uniref:Uncharacterized protein n=1 Tax=Solimonas terrae TaxID=1396819 RepID=A0A6M2BRL7_9GAMM|nr:hypothetical protein [Solimonas terrae]NGY04669.1 hypothetical protein [Solimonas terrae]